jgi:hypothetical protein
VTSALAMVSSIHVTGKKVNSEIHARVHKQATRPVLYMTKGMLYGLNIQLRPVK